MYEQGLQLRQENHYEWVGMIVALVFWVALITLLVMVIKHLAQNSKLESTAKNTALEILDTRYAKGEIDKKEYDTIKKDLTIQS
jgi:putative membrane protein